MKKLGIFAVAVTLLGASAISCDSVAGGGSGTPTLTSAKDSASYFIGINMGESMKTFPGGGLNIDLLIKGLKQAAAADSSIMPMDQMQFQMFMQGYFAEAEKLDAETNKAESTKFLEENKKKDGVQVTASGLQYKVISEGTGEKPDSASIVKVNYKGTLVDGKEFDNSYKRGEPATFRLDQVIKGWGEGIQLMGVGSKYNFYIPSELGYGERGMGNDIKGNSALIFEVELLEIVKPEEPETPAN